MPYLTKNTAKRMAMTILMALIFTSSNLILSAMAPAEAERLMYFEGKWSGKGKVTMDGKTMECKLTQDYTKTTEGWGLIMHETCEAPNMPVYKAVSLFGYDKGHNHYHLFTLSNDEETHDHIGFWTENDKLEFKYEGMKDGKVYLQLLTYIMHDKKSFTFTEDTFIEGKKVSSLEAKYDKR